MNNKAQEPDKDDPFIIIHNFRKSEAAQETVPSSRRPHREAKNIGFSIICTRKMAAKL